MSDLRWTHKTTRKLAAELRRQGFQVSHASPGRETKADGHLARSGEIGNLLPLLPHLRV